MDGEFEQFVGKHVVVDTDSDLYYIGVLKGADASFLTLENADIHHAEESATTRETYIMDSKKYGVRANRKAVKILRSRIVSVSLLDDVVEY
jgi:small nuclear ribonucleoprotein (snRNP)-like protein